MRTLVRTVGPQAGFPAAAVGLLASFALLGQAPVGVAYQISLLSQSAAPGTSAVFPVVFVSQGGSVSGVQFDLQYNSSAMSLAATVADAARISGKSLYSADLAPNKRRYLLVGQNQNVIPDGALMELFVNMSPNALNGVYPLVFSNVLGTGANGYTTPASASGAAMTVQGTVDQGVRLQPAGVLNGGSLLPGPVAPGEVVTLIGSSIGPDSATQPAGSPSSTTLAGTSVLFDGAPAPLLYAGHNQINAVVPYGMSGKIAAQLQVTKGGQMIASLPVSVAAAALAVFTLDASGIGSGAVLNQDSTVNSPSNPARRGSVAVLFATGAGQTDPPGMDGQVAGDPLPKPVLPVSVEIGGRDAEVLYAGAAPGLIAGVLQVNFRVPASVAPGFSAPVVLTVGGIKSQAGVTLAVQ